ncbi:hypothetical protein D3218_00405 [Aureimonas flava]|uniref:Uncharacterized protein n=1 Tax=Aureimonas flava TaxID=2320271 RepID=A0A3A1WW77_9HYPH|nr:hypothetical protein [Aureimonas flava]RIY03272.1 hypothetical protein D3218_00405 [Aureimonas flava]
MAVDIDWSFRISDIILFGTAGITVLVTFIRVQTAVGTAQTTADEAADAAAAASRRAEDVSALCAAKIDLLSREMAQLRVYVAENYTARKDITALEERLLGAVERLTDRVDQLVDQLLERRQ